MSLDNSSHIYSNENKLVAVLQGEKAGFLKHKETLADIFHSTCKSLPDNIAIIYGERKITYKELDLLSTYVAAYLNKEGIGKGDVVGLYMPRGADLLIAQLGITKSGAAWLPFESDTPHDRLSVCLTASEVKAILSSDELLNTLKDLSTKVLCFESIQAKQLVVYTQRADSCDIAYIIYTSGSTGTPKGISISHSNICHFLRSENSVLGVLSTDKVYQGFSCSFDMSFEEIWISYLVGASLWVAPKVIIADPDAIAESLNRENITVLHAVPTLLSLISDPLKTLRIINVGGEACTQVLATRLLRDKLTRKLFNTYGPTETTVSATVAELKLNEPINIGKPLPNYGILILNEAKEVVSINEEGEIGIMGPGLSPGYLNNTKLTEEKFITLKNPFSNDYERVYLTGDLGKIDEAGNVFCIGRIDNQVKLRGFRIEPDEISAAILKSDKIKNAAVVLRKYNASDELVAFVVTSDGSSVEPTTLKNELAKQVPKYMVPVHIEVLQDLPRLVSGKVDLKALKSIELKFSTTSKNKTLEPKNKEERVLFESIVQLVPSSYPTADADFFDDIGGHSLLAARLVSIIRKSSRYATLSISTIYQKRKLGLIAEVMAELATKHVSSDAKVKVDAFNYRRYLCGLAQACIVPLFITLNISDWLAPFFTYHYFTGDEGDSVIKAIGLSLIVFIACRLINFSIAIVGKRLLTRPLKPGRYPLWGLAYFNWWLATRFAELPDTYLITSTPWIRFYLRALGAKIGQDAIIDTVSFSVPELVTVGKFVTIGNFTNIENARIENGELIVGKVIIQDEASIESYCVIEENTCIGKKSVLSGLSCLSANQAIGDEERWEGAPASKISRGNSTHKERATVSVYKHVIITCTLGLSAVFASLLFFIPTFPAFLIIDWVDSNWLDIFNSNYGQCVTFIYIFFLALPASALFILLTMLFAASIRRILPIAKPQTYHINSSKFIRKKFLSQIIDSSLRELHGIYASVFVSGWLKLLGAKIGTNSEISNAEGFIPELLELGNDCFIADGASIGEEEINSGWITQSTTVINDRSFIGNSAYVTGGSRIPSDVLIGVQTRTPNNETLQSGQTWLGSPAVLLPMRASSPEFAAELTFRPSVERYIARATIELLRILTPISFAIAFGYSMVKLLLPIAVKYGLSANFITALSVAGCIYAVCSFVFVLALKWICIGRYKPRAVPMWTVFVWLSEAVTSVYESLAVPNLLNLLRGTPILPFFLRLLGIKIGKNVFLNTTDFTEFDCVRIGDGSELNNWCGPQTHLFEDRIMKIGLVDIGNDVYIGPRTIVLYDTRVDDQVYLGSLSLVSKGEHLPRASRWVGSPASSLN